MWFFFFLFSIVALAGAVGVVALRNPFYSVLALVTHLIALALLFLLLEAQFVAVAQIVVYAGAVMVLYVFVVAYVGGGDQPELLGRVSAKQRAIAVVFGAAIFVELSIALLGTALKAVDTHGAGIGPGYGSPEQIGELLLTRFLLPFELASFLLLVAAVGAVVLARRRGGIESEETQALAAMDFTRPLYTGTMAEAVGGPGSRELPEPEPEGEPQRTGGSGW